MSERQFEIFARKSGRSMDAGMHRQIEFPKSISIEACEKFLANLAAQLLRAEFIQTISEHWRSRAIEWNKVQNE